MPETTTVVAPGVPGWVDIASSDIEATKAFYTGLFGWTAQTVPDPAAGGYTVFSLGDSRVCAAAPVQNPNQPKVWSTYVIVEDADATSAKVLAAGGKVHVPTMQVMDQGRMAVYMDPTGAAISVWQPQHMPGATVFNVPGAICWNELSTRDVPAAKAFYNAVFGWNAETSEGEMPYTEWLLGEKHIGGMMAMDATIPAQQPAFWLVYFAVADINESVAKVTELGGRVLMPARAVDPGTFAVVADTSGAAFALIQMKG